MSLLLITLFIIKHYLCDFLLQKPRHYENKGTYGAWGGIEHALIHAMGTFVVALVATDSVWLIMFVSLIDAILHYHIDFWKVSTCKANGWTMDKSKEYWYMLGLDQALHSIGYILLTSLIS